MDRYTVIVVSDDRSPVRRFQLPKLYVKRAGWVAAVVALLGLVATWDYWRKWADNTELAGLRIEAAEQREQIDRFQRNLNQVEAELAKVRELERKVRIIANLPGAAAVGGAEVTEIVPEEVPAQPGVPAGVPIDPTTLAPKTEEIEIPLSNLSEDEARAQALTTEGARLVDALGRVAVRLEDKAGLQGENLELLLSQLDDKRVKLAAMPSVWPARGWLTSRFGPRISPFTGRRQHHAGIDIAARAGTPINAPANGRVSYVGRKGPMGNTLIVNHGFGVKTIYGHTKEIHVKTGEKVERGQLIASIGSSGRSTGPHLHYVVEVNGKPRNPLDYIFD